MFNLSEARSPLKGTSILSCSSEGQRLKSRPTSCRGPDPIRLSHTHCPFIRSGALVPSHPEDTRVRLFCSAAASHAVRNGKEVRRTYRSIKYKILCQARSYTGPLINSNKAGSPKNPQGMYVIQEVRKHVSHSTKLSNFHLRQLLSCSYGWPPCCL